MLNLSTQKLKIAETVAIYRGVTRAASVLQMTPSAVSQSCSSLEEEWGEQLFVRVGKEMVATPVMQQLLQLSRDYFDRIESLQQGAQSQMLSGVLRVGSVPLFAANRVVPKISEIQEKHPRARFSVMVVDTRKLIQELRAFKLDVAFTDRGASLEQHEGLVVEPVYEEKLLLCGSRRFLERKNLRLHSSKRPVAITLDYRSLNCMTHISYHNEKGALFKWYKHHFNKKPPLDYPFTIESVEGVTKAIDLHMGIGIIPDQAASARIESGEWVELRGRKEPLINSVLMCQLENRIPGALQREFCRRFRV
jgi:DNA-binding transcriptional LysR family regulator